MNKFLAFLFFVLVIFNCVLSFHKFEYIYTAIAYFDALILCSIIGYQERAISSFKDVLRQISNLMDKVKP